MKLYRNNQGSIIVEAALILPFVIIFVLFLTSMVKLAIYDVAVDHAVSEATKQISTHMYPIALAKNQFDQTQVGQNFNNYYNKGQNIADKYNNSIEDAKNLLSHAEFLNVEGSSTQELLDSIKFDGSKIVSDATAWAFTPVVEHYLDVNLDQDGELKVVAVQYPSFQDKTNSYFGLEVEYTFNLTLPFMTKNIVLKKKAYERVWIGS